jgi:hypothetical protein
MAWERRPRVKLTHWTSKLVTLAAVAAILPAAATAADSHDVTGTWIMAVETAMGSGNPTFTLEQDDENITGTYEGFFGKAPVAGSWKDDRVTLSIEVTAQGQDLKIDYVGTVDGDTMTGKVLFGELGEGTFEGARKHPEQE